MSEYSPQTINHTYESRVSLKLKDLIFWLCFIQFFLISSVYLGLISGLQGIMAITSLLLAFSLRPKFCTSHLILFGIVLYGLVLTIISPFLIDGLSLTNESLLRLRFWIFQLCYAFLGISIIRTAFELEKIKEILIISNFIIFILFVVALCQVSFFNNKQAIMFSVEPSQAGSVLLFWLSLSLIISSLFYKRTSISIIMIAIFGIILTGSKAVYLSTLVLAIGFLHFRSFLVMVSIFITLFGISFFFPTFFAQIDKISYLYQILLELGLDGLSYDYQIWDSWIVRIGSFISAILIFLDYPFGVGYGNFDILFGSYINRVIPINTSVELESILNGYAYATPKSYGMELVVSLGIVGLLFFISLFLWALKKFGISLPVICLLAMLVQTFIVELAPFLMMIFVFLEIMKQHHKIL